MKYSYVDFKEAQGNVFYEADDDTVSEPRFFCARNVCVAHSETETETQGSCCRTSTIIHKRRVPAASMNVFLNMDKFITLGPAMLGPIRYRSFGQGSLPSRWK